MGELDLALGGLDRAGERALLIAEQLRFEQILGNGRAIDRDEAAAAPPARLVQAARQQFLAGARGAEQHHRDPGVGDALDGARDLRHFGRGGDHRAEHGAIRADLAAEAPILALDAVQLEGAADDQAELIDVDRLLIEIISARGDRLERAFARAVAGGDDDLGLGLEREDLFQSGETFGDAVGIGRQAEVERHHRRFGRADHIHGRGTVRGDQHLIIVIGPFELTLQPFVILDDQQPGLERGIHARIRSMIGAASRSAPGRKRVKQAPLPSALSTSSRPPIAWMSARAS